jgi:hypothetical protein
MPVSFLYFSNHWQWRDCVSHTFDTVDEHEEADVESKPL